MSKEVDSRVGDDPKSSKNSKCKRIYKRGRSESNQGSWLPFGGSKTVAAEAAFA